MTNREKLNQMSNEELGEFYYKFKRFSCNYCAYKRISCGRFDFIKGFQEWLESEAEE